MWIIEWSGERVPKMLCPQSFARGDIKYLQFDHFQNAPISMMHPPLRLFKFKIMPKKEFDNEKKKRKKAASGRRTKRNN